MHTDPDINYLTKENPFFEIGIESVLGIEMQVFKNRPKNLGSFIELSKNHDQNIYLITEHKSISFSEHEKCVIKAMGLLRDKYDVQPGDRVAIYAANCSEWIIFFWATVSLGAIACGLNGWWNGKEAMKALNDAEPKILLCDKKRFERITDYKGPYLTFEDIDFDLIEHSDVSIHPSDEDDCACLLYTSGTTGSPKGVMTSHRSMINNTMLQLLQGAAVSMRSTRLGTDWTVNKPTSLLTSPLFHVSGLSAGVVTALFAGTTTYIYEGRFDPQNILRVIDKYKITSWGGAVPTALKRVLDEAPNHNLDYKSMLVVGGGGAPKPETLIARTKQIFKNVEHNFGYGYGLTESGAITVVNWGDDLNNFPRSPGKPMPTIEVKLIDDDGNEIFDDEVEGEICVRSPSVMLGYYKNQIESKKSLNKDRFLSTGDYGYRKDDLYFISSRRTDLILRGAENVYPQEIEILLDQYDGVAESAVIGVPHDDLGEEVKAIVVLENNKITFDELELYLKDNLAYFKVPSLWEKKLKSLPRNASGKVMKHVLIDQSKNNFVEDE